METRRELERRPVADLPRESFGELLGQLANNSAALVRDEIELARQEMREKAIALRFGLITVTIGSLLGLVALMALTAAAVICLTNYVGPGNAALIMGIVLAVIGGAVAFVGLNKINKTQLKPKQTIETLEEDKEWLKQLT